MGNLDRYRKHQRAEQNKGKPLGGGLDEQPIPRHGAAAVLDLGITKPFEQGGRRGLRVHYRLRAERLGGCRLILQCTLHERERGPLKSRAPGFADSLGALEVFEIFTPADDEATETERAAFVPFEVIEVEREGTLDCFARVRVLDAERGSIAEDDFPFRIEAG